VNLNAVAATTLYTVPAGKKLVLHYLVIRVLSGDAALTVATVGQVGALTDFLGAQTLSGLDAAAAAGILMPIPHGTTAKLIEYTAAEIIQIDVTTAAGVACTCTIEVFGTLMDA
jgi:hypothetical protein